MRIVLKANTREQPSCFQVAVNDDTPLYPYILGAEMAVVTCSRVCISGGRPTIGRGAAIAVLGEYRWWGSRLRS